MRDYDRIERAIHFLEDHFDRQPDLAQVARAVGLSSFHLQRLFSRWVGISPKRFLQFLTKEHAKRLLDRSRSVLDAAGETGLSGPSRLHDLFVSCEAVTPGEYKSRGEGLTIRYGFHPSPFGDCLLGVTERGICWLAFPTNGDRTETIEALHDEWRGASFARSPSATRTLANRLFTISGSGPLHLFLRGTNFQIKVWEALLRIPPGAVVTYQDLARRLGRPQAARAVGRAVGQNPISFLIPCHRVLGKGGELTGYRWGVARKKAILGWEWARQPAPHPCRISSTSPS